jgi:hypothetical protein
MGCWVLILATFCKLGRPIYKLDGDSTSTRNPTGSDLNFDP